MPKQNLFCNSFNLSSGGIGFHTTCFWIFPKIHCAIPLRNKYCFNKCVFYVGMLLRIPSLRNLAEKVFLCSCVSLIPNDHDSVSMFYHVMKIVISKKSIEIFNSVVFRT